MRRDAFLIVLGRHIESGLSVVVNRGQACATFQQEFHYGKRGVSLAGFMQRRVTPLISHIDPGAAIYQPPCSNDIALVCERVQQCASWILVDIDARFQTQ
jgi:hypothetical protein